MSRFIFITLFVFITFFPTATDACSCVGLPQTDDGIIEFAESVDKVFVGTVIELSHREWLDGDDVRMESKGLVRVVEAFRGPAEGDEVELYNLLYSMCGPNFQMLSTYLFFVDVSDEDGRPYANGCTTFKYTPRAQGDPIPQDYQRARIMQMIWALRDAFP